MDMGEKTRRRSRKTMWGRWNSPAPTFDVDAALIQLHETPEAGRLALMLEWYSTALNRWSMWRNTTVKESSLRGLSDLLLETFLQVQKILRPEAFSNLPMLQMAVQLLNAVHAQLDEVGAAK